MKQSVMLHFGYSILDAGLRRQDVVSQSAGLMLLCEYAAAGKGLGDEDWPGHVAGLVNEGLDCGATLSKESVAAVIAKRVGGAEDIAGHALDVLASPDSSASMITRAMMARVMLVELENMCAGEQLELEERFGRAIQDLPPAIRPSVEVQKQVLAFMNANIAETSIQPEEGYVPMPSGTPISGALALRYAVNTFRNGGDEEDQAAALFLLAEETRAQRQDKTLEECVDFITMMLKERFSVDVSDTVADRAKRRDFQDRMVLVGMPAGPPPGATIH